MPGIKYDSDGFAIDNFTNSIEDAAEFERVYNSHLYDDYEDDHYDEYDDEWDENEEDPCGCSDRCCPCGGFKA